MSMDWQTAGEVWDAYLQIRAVTRDFAYRILGPGGLAWEALATVFAALPALAAFQHSYDCGRRGARFSVRGYFQTWLHFRRARRAAYERTAASLRSPDSPVGVAVIAWLFMLMVALVGADFRFVALVYAIMLILLPYAYRQGRRERESSSD